MPELFHRYPGNPILTAGDWPYPANSVFNPGATRFNDEVLLLVRVEDFQGLSHLTVARSPGGRSGWRVDPEPTLLPDPLRHPEEFWGIEDPRIVFLEEEGLYAVTYVAYSRGGPLVALATTSDFKTFHRLGPILPPEDKDASLFPRRFRGRWAMIHRPMPTSPGARPNIWISFSPDLRHWGDHTVIIEARPGSWWDSDRVGLGPQPIETPEGWLILYHGVRQTAVITPLSSARWYNWGQIPAEVGPMNRKPNSQNPPCPRCGATHVVKNGSKGGRPRWVCRNCGRSFGPTLGTAMYRLRVTPAEVARTLLVVMRRGSLSAAEEITGHKVETIRRWLRAAARHAEALTEVLVHDLHLSEVEVDAFWSFVKKSVQRLEIRTPRRAGWARVGDV
jgi:predicted GH43/DUF377 family glycosyl hydrolase/transposase-like protein